jgi:hypothetical protein
MIFFHGTAPLINAVCYKRLGRQILEAAVTKEVAKVRNVRIV